MTEFRDFNEQYPSPEMEMKAVADILSGLKDALIAFDQPLSWTSADGYSIYTAEPRDYLDGSDVPYGRLKHLVSQYVKMETMNEWRVTVTTFRSNYEDVFHQMLYIRPGHTEVATASSSRTVFADDDQGKYARMALDSELRDPKNRKPASIRDYANLDNALVDLQPDVWEQWDKYNMYISGMTKEDMRNHRAMMREWIIERPDAEKDKVSAPKWRGITSGRALYAVRAATDEEAVLDLEDHLETGLDPLPMFFVEVYGDETQTELQTRHGTGGVHRLIPFSNVDWPEDPENLTPEQEAAFDRLRNPR